MNFILRMFLTSILFFLLLYPFQPSEKQQTIPTEKILLNKGWFFSQQSKDDWRIAEVPGVVHTDLLRNKMIPDPWYGTNEKDIQWVENENWIYRTTFELTQKQIDNNEINLVFEGLDTYAAVYLNDNIDPIGTANNMFLKWNWEVKQQLKVGINELKVVFYSPILALKDKVENAKYQLPASSEMVDLRVSPYIRKAPYHFGWDWGPRYVTCGIWRPVYLEFVEYAKINDLQVYQTELNEKSATIQVDLSLHIAKNGTYNIAIGGKYQTLFLSKGDTVIKDTIHINNPRYWWPNGWGEPNLYTVETSIRENDQVIAKKSTRIGLRTVELVQEDDSLGQSFYFKVNGKPIFAKGANYIPQSNFLPSVRKSQYDSLIHDVKAANMNMLRVWGGGIYENDEFYDLCDENGILIWQDFMFAGTMYPFDTAFLANVKKEATYNVLRLRNHPSLAYWNGNNEIDVAWKQWGWQKKYNYSQQDSTELYNGYLVLFDTLLRNVVKEFDPGRSYNPTSPEKSFTTLRTSKIGSVHYWGVWHAKQDFVKFRDYIGRFMAEYGFQSFPSMETIRTFSDTIDWDIDSEVMKWHQKSPIGNGMIELQSEKYFAKAKNFEAFVYTSQITQALAMQTAIDAHRLAKDYNGGTLYWQLNDCWPGPSWSSRDVFGRWKVLHKRLAILYSNLAVIPLLKNGSLEFYGVNDLPENEKVNIVLSYFGSNDSLSWEKQISMDLKTDKAYQIYTETDKSKIRSMKKSKSYFIVQIWKSNHGKYELCFERKIDRWDVLY